MDIKSASALNTSPALQWNVIEQNRSEDYLCDMYVV